MSFSEFSYGYAVVREIDFIYGHNGFSLPTFPTLREEASLGYDVALTIANTSFFLQFKRSDELNSRRSSLNGVLSRPYYRFPVTRRKKSRQHDILVQLASRLASKGHKVGYVAPTFTRQTTLARHYHALQVLMNSVFVDLASESLLPDDGQHYYNFDTSLTQTVFTSEKHREANGRRASLVIDDDMKATLRLTGEEMNDHLRVLRNLLLHSANTLSFADGYEEFLEYRDDDIALTKTLALVEDIQKISEFGLGLTWFPAFSLTAKRDE